MNQDKIGKFLASLRKENNLTQEDIAEKLNVSSSAVHNWRNIKNGPSELEMIKILSDIFKIDYKKL